MRKCIMVGFSCVMSVVCIFAIAGVMLLISLSAIASAGEADKQLTFDCEEHYIYHNVETEKGKVFTLDIVSNPTTGYSWSNAMELPSGIVEVGNTYVPLYPEPEVEQGRVSHRRCGVASINKRSYKAVESGVHNFILKYSRSWEKDVEPFKYIVVTVTVK